MLNLRSVLLEAMQEHNLLEVQEELHLLGVPAMEILVLLCREEMVVIMLEVKLLLEVAVVVADIMVEAEALVVMMVIRTHKLILA